jgi:hypothetical protein
MDTIQTSPLQKMNDFIGHFKVKKLKDLLESGDVGVYVVLASFVSVAEGVDAWFPNVAVKSGLKLFFIFFLHLLGYFLFISF